MHFENGARNNEWVYMHKCEGGRSYEPVGTVCSGAIESLEVEKLKKRNLKKKRKWSFAMLKKNICKNYELYLFVLPALIVLILFNYVPMYGLQIAFKEFVPSKGILGSQWAGLKHFQRFTTGYQFGNLMKNTFILALQVILYTFPIPVIFALFINQLKNGWKKM